jgi:tetratricopeptide (TPR) repeat protein
MLTRAYLYTLKWDDVEESSGFLLSLDGKWVATGHHLRAEIHLFSGRPDKALKEFKTAIRLRTIHLTEGNESRLMPDDELLGDLLLDLGFTYLMLQREDQARRQFEKAISHIESRNTHILALPSKKTFRSFVKIHQKLALLYESIDPSDPRIVERLEEAVKVYKITIFYEDDEFDVKEYREAKLSLARVKNGEPWTLPSPDALRDMRQHADVMAKREIWGVDPTSPRTRRRRRRDQN